MDFIARNIESMMIEVEVIAANSAAGYSLMKNWIMDKAGEYRAKGFARDVALAKAIDSYRN